MKMEENSIENMIQVDVERLEPEVIIDLPATSVNHDWSRDAAGDENTSHSCELCGKLYKSASNLQVHLALKHPKNEMEVTCATCDKQYPSLLSLHKHMRYKHFSVHNCVVCYRRFATQELLNVHEESCARAEMPCGHCGKVFGSAVALRNHIKYMHPASVDDNRCDICRRTFRSHRGLTNHVNTIHPPGTHCHYCHKSFTSISAFQSHNLHKHTTIEYRCSKCSRIFTSNKGLEKHFSRKHKKDFVCGLCKKDFTSSDLLVNHVMEEHSK